MSEDTDHTTPSPVINDLDSSTSSVSFEADELLQAFSGERFGEWYRERKYRQNIENGTPYFNGSTSISDPERHTPSQLLQCHRKIFYQRLKAPQEKPDPNGIFWFGSQFEEEFMMPYLRDIASQEDAYVSNSLWVDYTIDTDAGEIQIKGETDPVIVNDDAEPLFLFEIKTKRTIEGVTEPNRHHIAQVHAYMVGLSKKYEIAIDQAVIVYGSRTNLSIKSFIIDFDTEFWEEVVLNWAKTHTEYRLQDELPPSSPEYGWECQFCSYQERCGKGSKEYKNSGSSGLLPSYSGYPREKLVLYLKSNPDSKLTPTLAWKFPNLAEKYGVYDWSCSRCRKMYTWKEIDPRQKNGRRPTCPECSFVGPPGQLAGPSTAEQ